MKGLSESDFKERLKNKNKNQRYNKNNNAVDGKIIQDQEVALMSAVAPKSAPPKPRKSNANMSKSKLNIFKRIFNMLFGKEEEEKKSTKPRRYYNKNRRYNKNYKYNKYKSNNRRNYTKNTRSKNNEE
jgi:hypothetical protein